MANSFGAMDANGMPIGIGGGVDCESAQTKLPLCNACALEPAAKLAAPAAILFTPPGTTASLPLAVFAAPPLTFAPEPLAVLPNPPDTVAKSALPLLFCPPPIAQ